MSKNLSDDLELDDIIANLQKNVKKKVVKSSKPEKKAEPKEDNNDKKYKNDILGDGIPDYYKIIGVKESDPQELINRKCNQKLAEYHHDKLKAKLNKYPPEERKRQQKRYEAQYELIRTARDNLMDSQKRKYYDLQRKNIESSSFANKKDSFEKFISLQDSEITEENKEIAELEFKKQSDKMNKKHGFEGDLRMGQKDYHMTKDEMNKRYEDMLLTNTQIDADCMPKNMFANGSFNSKEFNRQWEIMQKKKEKKGKKEASGDKSIVQWDGIAAFNDHGACGGNYQSLDGGNDAYEGLYKTTEEKDFIFSSKLNSSDESSLSSVESDVVEEIEQNMSKYTDYDKDRKQTMKTYEERMREREVDDAVFDKRSIGSSSWKPVTDNPFNVSHQMGEVIGDDITTKKTEKSKKVLYEAYKALMQDRNAN
jgi:hypothetical protein